MGKLFSTIFLASLIQYLLYLTVIGLLINSLYLMFLIVKAACGHEFEVLSMSSSFREDLVVKKKTQNRQAACQ